MPFAPVRSQKPVTHREYFQVEHQRTVRDEFLDGALYVLPPVDRAHQRILDNFLQALRPQFQGSPCELVESAMIGDGPTLEHTPTGRFSYSTEGAFVRADVVILAEPRDVFVPSQTVIRNPSVIAEVAASGEEDYLCGPRFALLRKWLDHRFTDYVVIATDRPAVAHYHRQSRADWSLEVQTAFDDVVGLSRVGCQFTVGELYHDWRDKAGRPFVRASVCPNCGATLV